MSAVTLRRWHSYIGSFVAPSVLFFTLTGAVQLFNLHEDHGRYHAPMLLQRLSSVHKDQVLEKHEDGDKHVAADAAAASSDGSASHTTPTQEEESERIGTLALKWFFLIVAAGLALSTCFGVWMSLQTLRKKLPLSLLLAGTLLPIILLLF